MEILGKSPIAAPVLILGKLTMFLCWMFFLVKILDVDTMLYDSATTQLLGIAYAFAGLIIAVVGLVNLGEAARVGLPERKTELKTHGMYRFTRNPAYVGGFLVCLGSCQFSVHLVNFLLFGITFVIHHLIVKKEEEFLENTFGEQWLEYKKRVPRYVGKVKSFTS